MTAPLWEGHLLIAKGVGLKWSSPPGESVLAYNIYRRGPGESKFALVGSATTSQYRDETVTAGGGYTYVLTALDAAFKESPRSEELTLTYLPDRGRKKAGDEIVWKGRKTRLVSLVEGARAGFSWPADIAAGSKDGQFYLADTGKNLIFHFTGEGALIRTIGGARPGEKKIFSRLVGIDVAADDTIHAADAGTGEVIVLSPGGKLIRRIRIPPEKGGGPAGPSDVVPAPDGRLFVVDNSNNRVVVIDGDKVVQTFGGLGLAPGEFSAPTFCGFDAAGRFLLADTLNGRLQVFDASGAFTRSFGRYGQGLGMFARPKGVATSADGEIFVADSWQNVIQIFDSQGVFRAILTDADGKVPDLGSPNGIDIGPGGRIYIAERLARRVQVREFIDEP